MDSTAVSGGITAQDITVVMNAVITAIIVVWSFVKRLTGRKNG